MSEVNGYKHLERRPGSNYKQMFVKGRKIRAVVLYSQTIGADARSADEVAQDYGLLPEVVMEAIDYCVHHPDVLQEDYARETATLHRVWEKTPHPLPSDSAPES